MLAGNDSALRAFEAIGVEPLTIDNVAALQPVICCDILDWDYAQYQHRHVDVILASPPCTPRDLEYADSLAERALEIIP